jgi:hypothetical protein
VLQNVLAAGFCLGLYSLGLANCSDEGFGHQADVVDNFQVAAGFEIQAFGAYAG